MQPALLPQSLISPFHPSLPTDPKESIVWRQLHGSSLSLAILEAAKTSSGPIVMVTASERSAQTIEKELVFFSGPNRDLDILRFPDWECLPYDRFSPHQDIVSQRLYILNRTSTLTKGIIIISVSNLMQRLPPVNYIRSHSFSIKVGERVDIVALSKKLEQATYRHVSQVMTAGEFVLRGGIVDVFPMGSRRPIRIDFFDDEVESIRYFDSETQRSEQTTTEINILPAREFPLNKDSITQFRSAYRKHFSGDPNKSILYTEVSNGRASPGIEFYLPLFFAQLNTLFDFLPENSCWIIEQDCLDNAKRFDAETQERFDFAALDPEWPVLNPSQMFLESTVLQEHLNKRKTVNLSFSKTKLPNSSTFDVGIPVELKIDSKTSTTHADLVNYLNNYQGRTLLVAETAGHRENLLGLLTEYDASPADCSSWNKFVENKEYKLGIVVADIERGLRINSPALSVITESQLYGEKVLQRRRRNKRAKDPETIIKSLAELKFGDPVVHEELGVGRYRGLQVLGIGDDNNEFLTLEYHGGDKLYIPVLSFHLISRYVGANPENAPLHKLGGDAWDKAKKRAAIKVYDIAAELIEVQALRNARKGISFPLPKENYTHFAAEFPFEETADQEQVIEEVITDLESNEPMDRLVCGDVGFGKTEIALRAAYIAVHSHKQVAVLVPTTLLAQQHFNTFRERFTNHPVNISLLSRFRSKKDIAQTLEAMQDGACDIIIGTHRLLQKDISFKNLGLLILDEEHRFGVRQKETLKRLRSEVDILTLTATPIPRSLCMAMGGLRSISIIATPPQGRLSVKTFVRDWSNALVREACLRELHRGGQIYFLHNEVKTIDNMSSKLKELVPEADIKIAHGQMPESKLESIMGDFYHQRFNVLLCTTIIESGIDIPSANTIIINRADQFGLAQLHQLRGRVGRSHHQAFAYLLVNSRRDISGDAAKRLDAIEALEELGSGFSLASHDMEIRGAGELLGEAQSGMVDEIGFTLYTEYLNRAIKSIVTNPALVPGDIDVDTSRKWSEINLHIPTLFPETYLPDVHTRLVMYKRIANAENLEELKELRIEMIDRFGLLPEPGDSLFKIMELKLEATRFGIYKIDIGPKGGRIIFQDKPNIDPVSIINLIQSNPKIYNMENSTTLRLKIDLESEKDRIDKLKNILDYFRESNDLITED